MLRLCVETCEVYWAFLSSHPMVLHYCLFDDVKKAHLHKTNLSAVSNVIRIHQKTNNRYLLHYFIEPTNGRRTRPRHVHFVSKEISNILDAILDHSGTLQ